MIISLANLEGDVLRRSRPHQTVVFHARSPYKVLYQSDSLVIATATDAVFNDDIRCSAVCLNNKIQFHSALNLKLFRLVRELQIGAQICCHRDLSARLDEGLRVQQAEAHAQGFDG